MQRIARLAIALITIFISLGCTPALRKQPGNATATTLTIIATPTPGVTPMANIWPNPNLCPNPSNLNHNSESKILEAILSVEKASEIINELESGDIERQKQVTDPILWESITNMSFTLPRKSERLRDPKPAASSPYTNEILETCGKEILDASWWVESCIGDCEGGISPDLTRYYFFLERSGAWLLWSSYP